MLKPTTPTTPTATVNNMWIDDTGPKVHNTPQQWVHERSMGNPVVSGVDWGTEVSPVVHAYNIGVEPKPILLQIDSADPYYHAMVELHKERHQAYAEKQGYEYRVDPVPTDTSRWFRIEAIKAALDEGYTHVFYLDADACVADFEADLRDALPYPVWIGMTVHPFGFGSNPQWHFNTGVIYLRNCDEAKAYIDDVLSRHGEAAWDQVPMNDLLAEARIYQGGYRPLPQRYNQNTNHSAASRTPIIAAFHGDGTPLQRLARMQRHARQNPWH